MVVLVGMLMLLAKVQNEVITNIFNSLITERKELIMAVFFIN